MLERSEGLQSHLINDNFFDNKINYLKIIDDYHTKEINDEAINFFSSGFKNTGVKVIYIYYQIKEIDEKILNCIYGLANTLGINHNDLISYLAFILTTVNSKSEGAFIKKIHECFKVDKHNSIKADRIIETSIKFIDAFKTNGIDIIYRPYSSLNYNPPFHGRYWINEKGGYIVDGSLNTFSKGKIFAQKMDDENYEIIKRMVNNDVERLRSGYQELNKEYLINIHTRLKEYFNHI